MAHIAHEAEEDIQKPLSQQKHVKRIVADEHTTFRIVTCGVASEHIILPSKRHRALISLVKPHVSRPELSRIAFQRR